LKLAEVFVTLLSEGVPLLLSRHFKVKFKVKKKGKKKEQKFMMLCLLDI